MAAKKKRAKPRTRSGNGLALSPSVVLAGVVLTILAVSALFLVRGPAPVEEGGVRFQLDELQVEVEAALLRSGFNLDQIEFRRDPGLLTYEIRGLMPSANDLDRLRQRLRNRFSGIEDDRRPDKGELLIYRNGALACLLKFERHEALPEPPPAVSGKPRVVIIMDDLGRSIDKAHELVNLGIPVTFSVLPGEPMATDVALYGARNGYEIMIHVPMEPHSYPATNPGEDALLLGQSEKEIANRVRSYFKRVPYASGANNHMGSRFTEYEAGMTVVLSIMREKKMFFIDSRTTGQSVAMSVAQKVGVPGAVRDVFLDNEADVDKIGIQIRKLVELAEKKGGAIGICHPYPETFEALRRESQRLKNGRVEMVFASKLVSG